MRLRWICLALWLAGCAPGVPVSPPAPTAGGGGGAGIRPADPIVACPVDFSDALERAIAEVPDRRARDTLYVQWRRLDKITNAGGPTEVASASEAFAFMVDRLEARQAIEPATAGRLRDLVRCYRLGL